MRLRNVLNRFREVDLGLLSGDLRLVAHHVEWPILAKKEILRISDGTNELFIALDHIGSTAVRDMSAKPILDLVGVVTDTESVDRNSLILQRLGYANHGEFGLKGRRFLTLDDEDTGSYVHLHIFEKGDPRIWEHRLFRDYLNANVEARTEYERLKKKIATDPTIGRLGYSTAKGEDLNRMLREAKIWAESILKFPE